MLIQKSIQEVSTLDLFRELLDNASFRIIASTTDSAKCVADICAEYKIPLSSAYKKINKLIKHGLIQIDKIHIDSSGKRVIFYKSKIKKIQLGIEGDNLSIQYVNSRLRNDKEF